MLAPFTSEMILVLSSLISFTSNSCPMEKIKNIEEIKLVCIQVFAVLFLLLCVPALATSEHHSDKPFLQDYSIKFRLGTGDIKLIRVVSDRNGYIQILSSAGLLRPRAGQFLFPGELVRDVQDRQTSDKKIAGIGVYQDQIVYIDDKAVLGNAWAGKLYSRHSMPQAKIFSGGKDMTFIISDGRKLSLLKDSKSLWEGSLPGDEIKDIRFDESNDLFWILGKSTISVFSPEKKEIRLIIKNSNLTCIGLGSGKLIAGTSDGYFEIDTKSQKVAGDTYKVLPWTELTSIACIDGNIWFGSTRGAFMLRSDGKCNYYASERWLPSDKVVDISKGPGNSVLVLTDKGLGKICFQEMTLYEKAMFFEKQVRERHIRTGFNATVSGMKDGDVTTGSMEDSDNDGLWTSMYLAAETFRYSVTKSDEALQNVRESLDAMERLYTINSIPGFPSRSFERRGYKYQDSAWRRADDPEWDWKSTTSSDEAIGHIFAFGVIAELVDVQEIRDKAIMLIDTLMSHILKNRFYMIDWNGEPTRWGRWNPEYVNARPLMVGDRKITSSNITAMLQTAYHFTGKEKYKAAILKLMKEYGYLENLMRPMSTIGMAPADADELSKDLSDGWNHSDDEMYFCGYWGLYRYALNDTLKEKYKKAIIDHWEIERPEKEGLWNIMTAITGAERIDLDNAVWYLQKYPLDLVNWTIINSYRKDIKRVKSNFRNQTTEEVLPPDEVRIARHNSNMFDLDESGGGMSENSAGDIWLLPYWIGRYLGVIGPEESVSPDVRDKAPSVFSNPKNGGIYVIAHRGAHNGIPENTLAAYQKAIDLGCDFVEIDVRTTSDGKFVSMHNASTDEYIKGKGRKVSEMTLAELKSLDIGIRTGSEWENTRVPTFDEILQLCRGKIGIYLDLKDAPVSQLVEIIKRYKMERDIIWYIPASRMNEILEVEADCPDCIPTPDPGSESNILSVLNKVPAQILPTDMSELNRKFVQTAHSRNAKVFVDDSAGTENEWEKILSFHTDGIQTNQPEKLIAYLKKRK